MTDAPKIYVACLASYNNGILHGAWIDASSDANEMQDAVDAMLAASPMPDAEEFAIHDHDGINCSEYDSLQIIADKMSLIEEFEKEFGDDASGIINAYEDCFGVGNADDAQKVRDAYCGHYDSKEDYAIEFVESCGYLDEAPKYLQMYFDYEAFARDLFINDVCMSDDGHVFYNRWPTNQSRRRSNGAKQWNNYTQ